MDRELESRLRALLAGDAYASSLGIEVLAADDMSVTVTMTVRADHLNFMEWGHGGMIFALADTAFGLASNAGPGRAVGVDAHIAYLSGVRAEDKLVAVATEVSRTRRKGVYRIDVKRAGDDRDIATFTGTVLIDT